MAEEILRSRHAFGALESVLDAIASGKIDQFDILFLKDANGKPYVGWVDKDNKPVILQDEKEILVVEALPEAGELGKIYIYGPDGYFWNGTEFINLCKPMDVSTLETELAKLQSAVEAFDAELAKKADAEVVKATYEAVKYEVDNVPEGTLVNYFEREIRVMCPADSIWSKQNVGVGGDPNSYYMTFKTYAPCDEAVGYIEHIGDQVDAEILTSFSTDKNGRRYQPTWLALAKYDEGTGVWNYYGAQSSADKYLGFDYQIDWYDAEGKIIASDCVRINLSNEACHSTIIPSYASTIVANANAYTDEKVAALESAYTVVEF